MPRQLPEGLRLQRVGGGARGQSGRGARGAAERGRGDGNRGRRAEKARKDTEEGEGMIHDSCEGCRYDLGGGCCRMNMEAECGEGDRELWEEEDNDRA